jgi:predicted small lipoprotein YifL
MTIVTMIMVLLGGCGLVAPLNPTPTPVVTPEAAGPDEIIA